MNYGQYKEHLAASIASEMKCSPEDVEDVAKEILDDWLWQAIDEDCTRAARVAAERTRWGSD